MYRKPIGNTGQEAPDPGRADALRIDVETERRQPHLKDGCRQPVDILRVVIGSRISTSERRV
jgi:hypothetical protein